MAKNQPRLVFAIDGKRGTLTTPVIQVPSGRNLSAFADAARLARSPYGVIASAPLLGASGGQALCAPSRSNGQLMRNGQ